MATAPFSPFGDTDVPALTKRGERELKGAGTSLSLTVLEVLIVIDGFSTVGEIAQRLPHLSQQELDATLKKLAADKRIVSTSEMDEQSSGFSTITIPANFFSSLRVNSTSELHGALSILTHKGYYVRIARRRPEAYQGKRPTILVIDDDVDLQKLIRTYLSLEGLDVRSAFKRDDIVLALRRRPTPDLILLDVNLPDANGFDILSKMRQHPVLKEMPVIMLTAETTREAVLRGLRGGADGYVTKPFEQDWLVTAVRTVLGLGTPKEEKKQIN